jgi:ABC-type Fe3+ transport system substrate-binding protein
VRLTREDRQLTDWLGQGSNPVTLGVNYAQADELAKLGVPVKAARMTDLEAANINSAQGVMALLNGAPHPNAAKLFVNWMATKEGSDFFSRAYRTLSLRTDVDNSWAPRPIVADLSKPFLDMYDRKFILGDRARYREFFNQIIKD